MKDKMKQVMQLSLIGVSLLTLVACVQKNEEEAEMSSATTSSKSSKVDESSQTPNSEEAYAKVIEDFQTLKTGDTNLNVPLDSWTVETVINTPEEINYAFYDINKDGVDEMLVSAQQSERYLLALYYLKDSQPSVLGESYAASHGGARSSVSIYQDGAVLVDKWSSGNGNGIASAYQIQSAGATETGSVTYQRREFNATDLGLTGEVLDLDSVMWKSFLGEKTESSNQEQETSSQKQSMDIQAIVQGDFSSVAGVWRNGKGDTLEFSSSGLIGSSTLQVGEIQNQWLTAGLSSGIFGAAFYFIPSGVTLPSEDQNGEVYSDVSDKSRDRLIGLQYMGAISVAEEFYYRVE
ncbi:DUF6287 domain-containing protein [Streptococcus merionis]|uniref:DUF6287 domain-containing protein n=1 Tax=Streptococcus merionis TaxID=400065 RepID=UPI0035142485